MRERMGLTPRHPVRRACESDDGSVARWVEEDGSMTGDKFVEFLQRIIKRRRKPVFLIVDGHPTHKSKVVKKFVAENKERLELYFLPSYSPQLNPDEQVWNHLKNHTIGKRGIHVVSELKRLVHGHLDWMVDTPKLIRALFKEWHCLYAKA